MPNSLRRPKIRANVDVVHRKVGERFEVIFIRRVSGAQSRFLINRTCLECLRLFNGENSIQDIARKSQASVEEVRRLTDTLQASKVATTSKKSVGPSALMDNLFSAQLSFLSDFSTARKLPITMHSKLETAHVVIVGTGGIGSWVSYGLALAGVSRLSLFDPDKVSRRNLSHQCLFEVGDVGLVKSAALALKLERMFEGLDVTSYQVHLDSSNSEMLLNENATLIINCADEPDTATLNRILTLACFEAAVPHILCGGYNGHLSFLGPTVIPGRTACWFCYEKSLERRTKNFKDLELEPVEAPSSDGSISPIAAITANFHVLEALKVLSGYSKPYLTNRAAEINYQDYSIETVCFKRKKGCFCESRRY